MPDKRDSGVGPGTIHLVKLGHSLGPDAKGDPWVDFYSSKIGKVVMGAHVPRG